MVKNGGFISGVVLERKHKYSDFFSAQPHTNAHTVCGRPTLKVLDQEYTINAVVGGAVT